jgi:hypothetical protein
MNDNRVKIQGVYKGEYKHIYLLPDSNGDYHYDVVDDWERWEACLYYKGEWCKFREKQQYNNEREGIAYVNSIG